MKKLSQAIRKHSAKTEADQVNTSEEFKAYAHKRLSENVTYDFEVVEQVLESILVENSNDVKTSLEEFKIFEDSVNTSEESEEVVQLVAKSFYLAFDKISIFASLHKAWLEFNAETWYSAQISKALSNALNFIDQYASLMTYNEDKSKPASLNFAGLDKVLKNKQFAGVIKRSQEWKDLRDFLKKFDASTCQECDSAQGKAILISAFKEIEKFITIVSSK